MMINLIRSMLSLVPQRLAAARLDAPMMTRDRLARGRDHPTIRMNLANLLRCSCRSCPSFPVNGNEAPLSVPEADAGPCVPP